MGRQLMAEEPVFRARMEQCSEILRRYVSWTLLDELQAPEERSRLSETKVVQPVLFAIQVALVKLLKSWGVRADAVIGHSVGEVAAAHVAGVLPLDEAARLVAWRGRIMQKATGHGKMVWVALPAEEAALAIAGRESVLSIGAINDPGSVVLSGETAAVDEVVASLTSRGVQSRPLRVNYAFHSPQMGSLASDFAAALGRIKPHRAAIPFYSTVTGAAIDGEALQASYWARNVREPVQFSKAVAAAFSDHNRLFLEIGPHPVLTANLTQCFAARQEEEGTAAFTLRREADERRAMLDALATLYTQGVNPDWKAVQSAEARCALLPTYPWQRERYWVELDPGRRSPSTEVDPIADWFYRVDWPETPRAPADPPKTGSGSWLVLADRGWGRGGGRGAVVAWIFVHRAPRARRRRRGRWRSWRGGRRGVSGSALPVGPGRRRRCRPRAEASVGEVGAAAPRRRVAGTVVRALASGPRSPRLWVVTRGACPVGEEPRDQPLARPRCGASAGWQRSSTPPPGAASSIWIPGGARRRSRIWCPSCSRRTSRTSSHSARGAGVPRGSRRRPRSGRSHRSRCPRTGATW